jgi:hypothetical protein
MAAHILRLVLVLSLLLPGLSIPVSSSDAARIYPDDLPNKIFFPLVFSSPGQDTCQVVYQDPLDGTVQRASTSFDARWNIRNTGPAGWKSESVKIRFISGDRLHSGADLRDLPYSVDPGWVLDLVIPMTAPAAAGSYVSNWALEDGSTRLCTFNIKIRVQ